MPATSESIAAFKQHLEAFPILDPEGVHHELSGGMHGQKLDFDPIPDGSALYEEWTDVSADFIRQTFPRLPRIILGVANGTNRLALSVAERLAPFPDSNPPVVGLETEKDAQNPKLIHLTARAERLIHTLRPKLIVVLQDVSTTGASSLEVVTEAFSAVTEGDDVEIEVVTTWQRRPELEKLKRERIPYHAIINDPRPTATAASCRKAGLCAQGWELIKREK